MFEKKKIYNNDVSFRSQHADVALSESKLFGLKCFFKCVKQFGCCNLDFVFCFFLNLIVYFFHCDHGHLNT